MALEIRIKSEIGCLILNLKVEFDFHFSYSTAIVAKYIVICSKSFRKFATGQFTNIWCHIHQPCCINFKLEQLFIPSCELFLRTWEKKYKNEFLLELHGGRMVSTIHELSSDDLMDVRDPPFSSHIFWIKSKIINLID